MTDEARQPVDFEHMFKTLIKQARMALSTANTSGKAQQSPLIQSTPSQYQTHSM